MKEITKILVWWDDQSGVEPGWFGVGYDENGDVVADSQKIFWEADLEGFGLDDEAEMIDALRESYPTARVVKVLRTGTTPR